MGDNYLRLRALSMIKVHVTTIKKGWSKTCKLTTKANLPELLGRPTEMEYNHIHPNNRGSYEAGDY